MAFDDVTLFELHFDGATFGVHSVGEAIDTLGVTDPDRMVEDQSETVEAGEGEPSSRGRYVIGAVALVAAAAAVRAVYRRRRGNEGTAVAVESVDEAAAEGESDPVEQ